MADPATYRPPAGTIPTDPGVYRFVDVQDRVIYVGKAKHLRQRLNSYFSDPASLHPRTQTMTFTASRVEWTVVQNELEALQLEYTWIKQFDPRFNIKYRDDKSYPWLAITDDEYQRIFVGRGAKKRGWRYFGPFGQAWAIRDTLDLLLRVFPMRSCGNGVFKRAKAAGRPCLLAHIGKCSGPCVGQVDPDAHKALAANMATFLSGHSGVLERDLVASMRQAAAGEDFERAAMLRDAITALQQASERNAIVLSDGANTDVIALAEDPLEVAVQVFQVREGRVAAQRGWVADRTDDTDTPGLVEVFLQQLYTGDDTVPPPEVLVPVLPDSAPVLAEWLSTARGAKVSLRTPKRGDKVVLLETVARNAAETLAQHKLKRSTDLTRRNEALAQLQEALDMDSAPLRIECYDMSHTSGTNVVGSMVVFEDGLARKSEYRRFIIKSFKGSNDVAAMDEVLTRRFKRMLDDEAAILASDSQNKAALVDPTTGAARRFAYRPSLVVVDGGQPQVNAAQTVFDRLGIDDITLIGLAKRLEEVWLPHSRHPIILPRTSEGLYLLQRLRDEAHRFAISFHRTRRGKDMVESVLDSVPGLGEMRRAAVFKAYPSLKRLRSAPIEDLAKLPGIGMRTAAAIVEALVDYNPGVSVNTATGEIME